MSDINEEPEPAEISPGMFPPFEITPAAGTSSLTNGIISPQRLFGNMWIEGEVAVLLGEPGVGKSILAVQIAEMIARRRSNVSAGTRVLYLDMEFTPAQFVRRYSIIRNGERISYDFSPQLQRAGMASLEQMPEKYENKVGRFISESICELIASDTADIIILDNISYLSPNPGAAASGGRLLKTLKILARACGVSILTTVHMKRRGGRTCAVNWGSITEGHRVLDLADSVFMLGSSTLGDNIRYLKHLKSRSEEILFNETNVPVFRVCRMQRPPEMAEEDASDEFTHDKTNVADRVFAQPPVEMGVLSMDATPVPLVMAASDWNPEPGGPFLGLQHIGSSKESEHLRDYRREKELREIRLENLEKITRRLNSARKTADMLLSRDYRRYLEP